MHSLQKQFHDFISANGLIHPNENLLVAVSGGVDSMVLSDLLQKGGFRFSIAHCNYGLRGKESDEDAEFVREWAKAHEIPCHTKRIDLGGASVQLAARNARYEWFDELTKEFDYQKILTAHHSDDALETLLYNLSRGTGIRGIAGISVTNGNVARPLLFASKEEIRKYAKENQIKWREDSSNTTLAYDRNYIRQEIISRLKELNPSLVDTYKDTQERLRLSLDIVLSKVNEVRSANFSQVEDRIKLDLDWVSSQADLIILSEILSVYGFSYTTCKEIFHARSKSGKEFISANWRLTIDRGCLYLQQNNGQEEIQLTITSPGIYKLGNSSLVLTKHKTSELKVENSPMIAFLDASKIHFPLTIRSWREGDRFKPLGMDHSKKISDFLIDEKVPVALKKEVNVMISNNEIVWVLGYRISNDFKLYGNTHDVLKVALT